MEDSIKLNTLEILSPSGHHFTIREQNGEDEDIISNQKNAKNLMNLTRFIAAIVVKTDFTESGKLTIDDSLNLPLLDRYFIIIMSRIFSIGALLDFDYTFPDGKTFNYTEDLNNLIFADYSKVPTQEEMEAKPNALPYYPVPEKLKGIEYTLASGKVISFDLYNGHSEQFLISLPDDKKTRNSELLAHNLKLAVDGKFEVVQNFKNFSVKDMAEMRKVISSYDPIFQGVTEVTHPDTGEVVMFPVMAAPSFFFPTEM